MKPNAYILDWTMNEYDRLLARLEDEGFIFQKEGDKENVRGAVPFSLVDNFTSLVQGHLNAPYNYVDIQYPDEKKTVVVFQNKKFVIENDEQNEMARKFAINLGLPTAQADWAVSFLRDG